MHRFIVFFTGLLALAAAGCSTPVVSQQPVPSHHPVASQPVLMSQQHWQDHAEAVVEEVFMNPTAKAFINQGVSLAHNPETPFGRIFRAQLAQAFTNHGIPLVQPSPGVPSFDFEALLLRHGNVYRKTRTGTYESLAPGFALKPGEYLYKPGEQRRNAQKSVEDAMLPTEAGALQDGDYSRQELVIQTILSLDGSELARSANGFYVPSEDWSLYARSEDLYDPYASESAKPVTKPFTLVN